MKVGNKYSLHMRIGHRNVDKKIFQNYLIINGQNKKLRCRLPEGQCRSAQDRVQGARDQPTEILLHCSRKSHPGN